jgi:hypothetical protein
MPNPWVIIAFMVALATAAGGGYYRGNSAGRAEVKQEWDKEKTEQYADFANRLEVTRKREQELQANADQLRKEKDAEIRNVNARATALSNSMRNRTDRPAEGSGTSQTANASKDGSSGTGAGLYRPDAEFLVGEAARGNKLRAELKACYTQYDNADKVK